MEEEKQTRLFNIIIKKLYQHDDELKEARSFRKSDRTCIILNSIAIIIMAIGMIFHCFWYH